MPESLDRRSINPNSMVQAGVCPGSDWNCLLTLPFSAPTVYGFDERLEERTRLARDLHDTLLQTIQGSKLAADHAEATEHEDVAKVALRRISNWLERATCEGRAALESLRSSTTEGNNLAAAFREVFEDCRLDTHAKLELSVNGISKEMHPIARDEVYRIGYEAIRNACIHSGASELRIELTYNPGYGAMR